MRKKALILSMIMALSMCSVGFATSTDPDRDVVVSSAKASSEAGTGGDKKVAVSDEKKKRIHETLDRIIKRGLPAKKLRGDQRPSDRRRKKFY